MLLLMLYRTVVVIVVVVVVVVAALLLRLLRNDQKCLISRVGSPRSPPRTIWFGMWRLRGICWL